MLKESQRFTKKLKLLTWKSFGEDIYNIIMCAALNKINKTSIMLFPNIVIVHFNVFGCGIKK